MSKSHRRPASRQDYRIAVICALPIESDAVEAMFDEAWEDGPKYAKVENDPNAYRTGRIGEHYVVLAFMPGLSKANAAKLKTAFKLNFPEIRLGLVVGICGGTPYIREYPRKPREIDVFLGDIIISTEVLQHDLGHLYSNEFVPIDILQNTLGRPSFEIRAFLHKMQGLKGRARLEDKIRGYLADISLKPGFETSRYQGMEKDILYKPEYIHKHHESTDYVCAQHEDKACQKARESTCEDLKCNSEQSVLRTRLRKVEDDAADQANASNKGAKAPSPLVHFGRVVSGHSLVKSAIYRDELADNKGVIGFEMEGAGAWDGIPIVVIKSVVDYADSHKSYLWQKYGAACGAACMKAFVNEWSPKFSKKFDADMPLPYSRYDEGHQISVKELADPQGKPIYDPWREVGDGSLQSGSHKGHHYRFYMSDGHLELVEEEVPEEVSAKDYQPVTGKAKELNDTGASFSELDHNGVLKELSAQDDQSIRQQSREEAKTQNLRSVLSRFGLGERPLIDGKKRVRWRCGCGRNCYDDFTELRSGAAAELEKWLNDSMRKHAGSSASNSQQSAALTSAIAPNAGSSGYQQTAESYISLQSLGPSADVLPASNMNAAVSIDVNLQKCWLILCGNMKRGPDVLLTQMNLCSTSSDKSLFDNMKSVYSNFKRSWTLRSFLRGVKTIRFVQFQLHKSARVDIRKAPDMPPESRRDEYLYEPYDLIPPVGENFMTHWFHHPEDAWEFPWAYSLIPKRLKGELEITLNQAPRVGWDIQIVEGWLSSRLWLLSLSLFLCGSLAFAICWAILEHDIQGAFGVSAYVVALLTLAVGAAQANLD